MSKNAELKQRILKGIKHFENIKPSQANEAQWVHVKILLKLMEMYINNMTVQANDLTTEPRIINEAKEIFKK